MIELTKEKISLCKQIAEIKKEKEILLNRLYDLGLAPFYGYYELMLAVLEEGS